MKLLDPSHLSLVIEMRDMYRSFKEAEGFGILWTDKHILQSIERQEVYGQFDEDGEFKAYLVVRKLEPTLHEIDMMMTHPEHNRRGYMQQLFQSWLQSCQRPWEVWLEVHEKNVPAIRFYEKQGFLLDSHRPNYYPDGGSALLYSLKCN